MTHNGDVSFQAINCSGTDNQTQTSSAKNQGCEVLVFVGLWLRHQD